MEKLLSKKQPEKSLLIALKKTGGRNRFGRITVRHRGGGARKLWRKVDFGQEHFGIPGTIAAIEYDPNRNAFLALIDYQGGGKGYVVAPQTLRIGDEILCQETTEPKPGNRMRLKHIPIGSAVFNIELEPGRGGKIVRGAGTSALLRAQEGTYAYLVLPSGEVRKFPDACFATVGAVSNQEFRYQKKHKAGSVRNKGRRPQVRGSAMNPVDHPHGGGEGRSPIGMSHPKTPWGKPAYGVKTRNKKKWTNKLIVERRKKKKRKK